MRPEGPWQQLRYYYSGGVFYMILPYLVPVQHSPTSLCGALPS